jgi:hypothetical protein
MASRAAAEAYEPSLQHAARADRDPAVERDRGCDRDLCRAGLLATPYVHDYDLVVPALAIAFLARHGLRHGFRDFEPRLSCGIAGGTGIPLRLMVLLAIYVVILRCATKARTGSAIV